MAGKKNFDAKQGDTFRKICTYSDGSGTPVDLTGATISGKVKKTLADTGVNLTCALVDAVAGKFKFELSAVQTAALDAAVHMYEVQITFANGDVKTLLAGNLVVTAQVA